ncbi:MAG TPA: glycosyltransferase family 2 protein [Candidatus Paceibacterota bacterium]
MKNLKYSLVIPVYNEEKAIGSVLEEIFSSFYKETLEVIVVDDGSTDKTAEMARKYPVRLVQNIKNSGYGYSLKQGIKIASHPNIIITDGDGSYPISGIVALFDEYEKGYDMVVGARRGKHYKGSFLKSVSRFFFRSISEFATGQRIPDINSGCRIFRKDIVERFFNTLSSGFSFTTTITLAFMLNTYSVQYVTIDYHKRSGSSKVRYIRDILRSLQLIVEAIVFYNPLKMYLICVVSAVFIAIMTLILFFISFPLAILFFFTAMICDVIFSIGLAVIFLKFMHNDPA